MRTISFSGFVYEDGKSGISEYINSVLTELSKTNYIIVHLLAKDHCYLPSGLSDEGKNIRYKIYSNILSHPILNLMFHTFVMPWIFMFEKSELVYLPAANRRQLLFYSKHTIGVIHDLAELHIAEKFGFFRWLRMKFYTPLFLRGIHKIIAVSNTTKDDLIQFYNLKEDSITVAYNGIKSKRVKYEAGSLNRSQETRPFTITNSKSDIKHYFLYVSRIEHPGKNHIRLIEAYEKTDKAIQKKHHLIFAGNLKENHQVIVERVNASPLKSQIHILGFVDDDVLHHLYQRASLYICPSLYEGFGLTVIEAMNSHLPVISSNRGALPEICGDGAHFFNPYSVDEIKTSIERVISDDTYKKKLQDKGKIRVAEFSWEKHVKTALAEETI